MCAGACDASGRVSTKCSLRQLHTGTRFQPMYPLSKATLWSARNGGTLTIPTTMSRADEPLGNHREIETWTILDVLDVRTMPSKQADHTFTPCHSRHSQSTKLNPRQVPPENKFLRSKAVRVCCSLFFFFSIRSAINSQGGGTRGAATIRQTGIHRPDRSGGVRWRSVPESLPGMDANPRFPGDGLGGHVATNAGGQKRRAARGTTPGVAKIRRLMAGWTIALSPDRRGWLRGRASR